VSTYAEEVVLLSVDIAVIRVLKHGTPITGRGDYRGEGKEITHKS
jgi:hypothetical protein